MVAGEHLNHLLLVQLKNWLNGFQFSYEMEPEELHTISATYGSANLFTYSDDVWETYKFGEKYDVVDPATGEPAMRNVFWPQPLRPRCADRSRAPRTTSIRTPGSRRYRNGGPSSSPDTRPWIATPVRRWRTVGFPPAWIRRQWSPISRRTSFRMRC